MSVFHNNALIGAGGGAAAAAVDADIPKSLRFNSGDSAHLHRAPSSAGNQRTFTWSAWIKRCKLSTLQGVFSSRSGATGFTIQLGEYNTSNDYIVIYDNSVSSGYIVKTSNQLRDVGAWYHVVVAVDSTQSTASNRLKVYINGVEAEYGTDNRSSFSQNTSTRINSTNGHTLGSTVLTDEFFDGYLADVYLIDGSQLQPTSFGQYDSNGVWQAIQYSGTFGTNGVHLLDFANESTIGHDSSGSNNDFTGYNFSTSGTDTDILFDAPINGDQSDTGAGGEVSGCYAVWNALGPGGTSTYGTLSNGNLDASLPASGRSLFQTIFPESGKWYVEIKFVSGGGAGGGLRIGVINENNIGKDLGSTADSWAYLADGRVYHNGSAPSYGVSSSPGDLLMIALDIDAGKLWYGNDGTWMASGDPANGNNPSQTFTAGQKMSFSAQSGSGTVQVVNANWGQRAWTYTAPSGFKAVCTANLATPTVADGADYFDAKTYTGNGSTQSITGFQFSPDWVWYKDRGSTAGHALFDSVRGAQKRLRTMTGAAEATDSTYLTSFNSDGFTVGSHVTGNNSGSSYIAWCWDAGSSTASNTNGSITSSVRASQTSGFSIVSYTGNNTAGATIGHGLSAAPEVVIYKNRDRSENWGVYSKAVGASKSMYFNLTQIALTANASPANMYNGTDPSSTVLTVGDAVHVNANTEKIIAYCFAPVAGFSAMGVYTGNGSSSTGPFIHTGFKVAFLITKRTDSTTSGDWNIVDTTRGTYNPVGPYLYANESNAEGDVTIYDLLSNGFKIRESGAGTNANGSTYFYLAFAENPFQANGGLAR